MNWDLPKQTFLRDDARGIKGDCWRCCIAALLQVPAETVPHFLKDSPDDMYGATQKWLNERGLWLFNIPVGGIWHPGLYSEHDAPPIISCGPTPRSTAMHMTHAVITVNRKMVYDPHPDNNGLTAVTDHYIVAGMLK